jgi:Protein of unknown function (DUF2848)
MLTFKRTLIDRSDTISMDVNHLIIAGWAGRDEAALRHHIEELAAIGVPRPSSVPVFYRVAAATLTQGDSIEVLGPDSSGEAEPIVVAMADGLWIGIGSDHTDRKAETVGIALSKQMCPKIIGRELWSLAEIAGHWDKIEMRSFATISGERVLYQEGKLASLRHPQELIGLSAHPGGLPSQSIMFGGTLGAIGGIRPADSFEMELVDPVLKRRMSHHYAIKALPVIS